MIRKAAARDGLFCLVVLFCCCGLYLLPPPPSLLRQEGTSALAYVTKVDNADIRQHGLIRAGSQQLEVEVADGEWKGRRFRAGNELRGQLELDKEFRVGDLAVVTIPPDASPESSVLVARDRSAQTLDAITGIGNVSRALLHKHLRPHLDTDCLLVSDGNPSYHVFAREAGISHKAINLSIGRRVRREGNAAYHVQHVNAYHGRLRQWMLRFRGVATKYLANYLAWFRGLDTHRRDTPQTILFAAVGAFP